MAEETSIESVETQESLSDLDNKVSMPFTFHGKTGEFFKIWIVNVALSIATCGIYSAWAKVRTRQYMYGNTILDDSSFRYNANPVAILKGRLIATVFFIAYYFILNMAPNFYYAIVAVFVFAFPWLIIKSLRFNARYTTYRNINFGFNGTYGEAISYWFLLYIAVPFTFGLIIPFIHLTQKKFIIDRSRYGTSFFKNHSTSGYFYKTYLVSFLIAVFGLFIFVAVLVGPISEMLKSGSLLPTTMMAIIYLVMMPLYLFSFTFVKVLIYNYMVNNTVIENHRLKSTQEVREVFWIYLSNVFAIVCSLGLLIPWAMIRMTRYKVEHTELLVDENLDSIVAAEEEKVAALGEELGEVFDIDISL